MLTEIDEVHFSLDGYDQQSNEQYRVNCNWESIVEGIKTLRKSNVFMRWAAIAFSFNENHLDYMKELAIQYGFDIFQLTKSTKFGKIYPSYPKLDALQPRDNLISTQGRFTREEFNLSGRIRYSESLAHTEVVANQVKLQFRDKEIVPLCYVGNKGLYLSSLGKLYPCCWVANRYNHNNEWSSLGFDLNKTTLEESISDPFWTSRFTNFEWQECKTKCVSTDERSHYINW